MGYGVRAYAVDLDRLLGAIGSGDRDLAAAVKELSLDRIERYELSDTPGQLGKAIERLIAGDFDDMGDLRGHDLGYALECLASFFSDGEIYGDDALKSIAGGWLYDQPVLKELAGSGPKILAQKMPLPDDFPGIHIVAFQELDDKANAVRAVAAAAKPADRDLRDGCADYLRFLEIARRKGCGLITFYY